MARFSRFRGLGIAVALAALACPGTAWAGQDDVMLMPAFARIRDRETGRAVFKRPDASDPREVQRWAHRLDALFSEAAQDLGLTLDVSERSSVNESSLTEDSMIEHAKESWVVSPRFEVDGGSLRLRLLAVAPGSKVILLRSEEVSRRDADVRAMVMLRDLIESGRGSAKQDRPTPAPIGAPTVPARSAGRAVLALNSAAFGGFVGFAIQRGSGSDDDRLTYPLIALGTGVGLGASMIVADEWNVGLGDAWYLSAGAWWPAASAVLLADSYDVNSDERYTYGLLGALGGLTLATTSLTLRGMGEGGATLTHSGGALGLLVGGMTQFAYEGNLDETPSRGMGYGAGLGVLTAGVLATQQLPITPSRVLLVDLGAVLGGLTGAAAASPLVFADESTKAKNRAFVGAIAAGTLVGAGVAWWITQPATRSDAAPPSEYAVLPYGGVIDEVSLPDGSKKAVVGGGVQGLW